MRVYDGGCRDKTIRFIFKYKEQMEYWKSIIVKMLEGLQNNEIKRLWVRNNVITFWRDGSIKISFSDNMEHKYVEKLKTENIFNADEYFKNNKIEDILSKILNCNRREVIFIGIESTIRKQFFEDLIEKIDFGKKYACRKVARNDYRISTENIKIIITGTKYDEEENCYYIKKEDIENYNKILNKMKELING